MAITHETGSRLLGLFASALAFGITSTISGPGYAQIDPQTDLGQPGVDQSGSMLQPSDQGNAVADLQQRLAGLGYYNGPVTGYFDTSTHEAVVRFQQANGLAADGIVGAATSNALNGVGSGVSATPEAQAGSTVQLDDSGNQVSALQQQLSQLGYYTGAVTGVFDSTTQAAVVNFQRARGLAADGIVGSATLAALAQPPQAVTPASTPTYTPTATPSDGLLQLGDVGSEVSDLQTQLQALGYYDGPISGSFGSQTQTALIAFQQAQGLTADGIAGPQVSAALGGVGTSAATSPATSTATASPVSPAVVQPVQSVQPAAVAPAVMAPGAAPGTLPAATIAPAPVTAPLTSPTAPIANPGLGSPASVQVPALPALPPADPSMAQAPQASAPNSSRQQSYRNPEGGRFGVAELQRRLQMRGFDPGQMNGVYDTATQDAITQAQEAYGISGQDLFR